MLWKYIQHSFSGGIFDRALQGRQDLEKYFSAASNIENFTVRRQGNLMKRMGTDEVADIGSILGHDENGYAIQIVKIKVIPVTKDTERARYLILTGGFIYVADRTGVMMSDRTTFVSSIPDFEGKDLTGNSTNAENINKPRSATVPYRFKTSITDEMLDDLDFKQSGDTIFFAHRDCPPIKFAFDTNGYGHLDEINFDNAMWNQPVLVSAEMSGNDHTTTTTSSGTNHTSGSQSSTTTTSSTSTSTISGAEKKIRYCVSYVKDGFESSRSNEVEVEYTAPWMQGAVVSLAFSRGNNTEEPDYYNIYKNNGSGYGLIGVVDSKSIIIAKGEVSTTKTKFYVPDNDNSKIRTGYQYETNVGVTVSEMFSRLVGQPYLTWPTQTSNEISVCSCGMRTGQGAETYPLKFSLTKNVFCSKITIGIDARVKKNGNFILVPSSANIEMIVTFSDDTTETIDECEIIAPNSTMNVDYEIPDWNDYREETVQFQYEAKGVNIGVESSDFDLFARYAVFELSSAGRNKRIKDIEIRFGTHGYTTFGSVSTGSVRSIRLSGDESPNEFQDNYITPSMETTPNRKDVPVHFSSSGNYPACLDFYKQRMVLASTKDNPFTFWLSQIADLYNFVEHETMVDDDPIEAETDSTTLPNINRIVVARDMIIFTDGGEYMISPVNGNALTFKTICSKRQSQIGCARWLRPICVKDEIVFADRTGRTVYSAKYNLASDGYDSRELSVMAQDIFRTNYIVDMQYRRHPDSVIECVLSNGDIASLVYMTEQGVYAWCKTKLGGSYKAVSIACPITQARSGTSEMALIVRNESDFRMWMCREQTGSHLLADTICMDGIRLVGYSFLSSCTDNELSYVRPDGTTGKVVEMTWELGDTAYVGYVYDSIVTTVRPEQSGKNTSIQFEIKDCTEAEVRVIDSSSFEVKAEGVDDSHFRLVDLPVTVNSGSVTLTDRDCKKTLVGRNSRDGRVTIRSRTPYPLNIPYIAITYQIENENGTKE